MSNTSRMYAAIAWGLGAAAAFYVVVTGGVVGACLGEGAQAFVQRYCAGHPVEYVEVAMFFVGMAVLVLKRGNITEQLIGLKKSLLGPMPPEGQTSDDCPRLLAQLDQAPSRQQQSYLFGRLHNALSFIRRKGSAEELDRELKYLSELDESRAHAGFGLVRVIIWSIPILGFLGTVIGITMAIAQLDPRALENSLNEVVSALAVAFDTTALALALSIVLMFTQFAVDRSEQRLLASVDAYVDDDLSARFLQNKTGGHPEVAAVRRMSDALLEATGKLVERQAELWQSTISEAQRKWGESLSVAHQQVEDAMGKAMTNSLDAHARQISDAGQRLAQQNHQHWGQVQQALAENLQAMREHQGQLVQQSQTLHEVVAATGQLTRMEEALNRNLAAVAGSHDFEKTLDSLAAVIHLLNARLSHPGSRTDPDAKTGRAA